MVPSQINVKRHLSKTQPPLEGGEEKHAQEMGIPSMDSRGSVNIQRLREQWFTKYADMVNRVPMELPPLREVNHWIPLIDEAKRYIYHMLRCPEAMRPQLMDKVRQYTDAEWWIPKPVPQAALLLCIPKKSGKFRTVMDCCQRNDNTIKDVTPFPDQDQIWMDVAQVKFRLKIDLSNAYKQVCIEPDDVHKTRFATVYGTMESNVLQQGNCNGPATFQQLITVIFRDTIGLYVHVYLDDLFIFSYKLEDYEKHLEYVFQKLHENHLFVEKEKCDLYSTKMDCLGHLINDQGLHADADKMVRVCKWLTPQNHKEVQRFLGLVQYLAHFMLDVTAYTGPLAAICRNGQPFYWKPLHDACFSNIKVIACKSPILKLIDPQLSDPIWAICDASLLGIGAMYGQGVTWQTCRPAGFMSKKFTAMQMNYRVFEMETIAILEALLKWEDKLLGRKLLIVTDHKALEFFKTQQHLNS